MTDFFVLTPSSDERFWRAGLVRAPGTTFDGRYERQFVRGLAPPPEGLAFVVTAGREAPDVLGNTRRLPAVSHRVAEALRALGATGVKFHGAVVEGPDGVRAAYETLVVFGKAELHRARSGVKLELQTGLMVSAPMAVEKLEIDEEAWDGADVFSVPEYPLLPIVTARVFEALSGLNPTGIALVPAASFKPH